MTDAVAFDPETYARSVASAIGLPLDPDHLPGVTMNLVLAARMAAILEAVPLSLAEEAAPVYVAGRDAP